MLLRTKKIFRREEIMLLALKYLFNSNKWISSVNNLPPR